MNPLHTVTLDADAETLLSEHGVMVVDGDYQPAMCPKCGQSRTSWNSHCHCPAGTPIGRTIPPSWAIAAALIEVKTSCDNNCIRFDGKVPGHVYGSNWPWVPCQTCMGTMLVSSFWTVGEVVPIEGIGPDDPDPSDASLLCSKVLYVHGDNDSIFELVDRFESPSIETRIAYSPGDPADLIGKFALVNCEQVTR